jgi:hypothetical protein
MTKRLTRDAAIAPVSIPKAAQAAEAMTPPDEAYRERMKDDYRAIARRQRLSSSPVETLVVNPELMRVALQLADGDPSRLVLNKDGSVLITNRGRGRS